jgi:hypothetical protein
MKSGLLITALLFSVLVYAQQPNPAAGGMQPVPTLVGQPAAAPAAQPAVAPAPAENKNAPEITFQEEVFDFGTVKQGEKVTHIFTFTNTGKEPLIISTAAGSCHCTVPEWPKEPIKKGEKATIKVVFDSSGKMGTQDKTVTIQSNAKTNPKVIHMKGTVESPAPAPAVSDPTVK